MGIVVCLGHLYCLLIIDLFLFCFAVAHFYMAGRSPALPRRGRGLRPLEGGTHTNIIGHIYWSHTNIIGHIYWSHILLMHIYSTR